MRTLIKTPSAVLSLSPYVYHINRLYNQTLLGMLNSDDVSVEDMYYLEYYGIRLKREEESIKFKATFEGLSKLFTAHAKATRGRL